MDPADNLVVNAESMELQQKPLVADLVKGLAEVHDYYISLAFLIKRVVEILCKLNELSLAAYSASETMLILEENVIFV